MLGVTNQGSCSALFPSGKILRTYQPRQAPPLTIGRLQRQQPLLHNWCLHQGPDMGKFSTGAAWQVQQRVLVALQAAH